MARPREGRASSPPGRSRSPGVAALRVREATADDLGALLEFRLALLADVSESERGVRVEPTGGLREDNARWLADHLGRDLLAFVAVAGGEPVACAGVLWFDHPPGIRNPAGLEAYIVNVYTRPEWRGRGTARLLVSRAVEAARSVGAGRIWLRSSPQARPLYNALGFREGNYLELPRED